MRTLTRPQRQILATLAVLGLMVAPTAYVGLTAWRVHQPAHRIAVQYDLGRRLGLGVELGEVRYPRTGVIAYRGVILSTQDAGRGADELVRAEAVRLRPEGRALAIEAEGLVLSSRQGARHALEQLARALQQFGVASEWEQLSLLAPRCTVDLGPDLPTYRLRDLAWTYRADPDASRLTASYRVEDGDAAPRCELSLVRAHGSEGLHTTLSLRSADGATLPSRLLAPFFDTQAWLGPAARVAGELVLSQAGRGAWEAEFRGAIDEVDLSHLAAQLAPEHRLAGRATLHIESAHWGDQQGRGPGWVAARGRVVSTRRGTIGAPLLAALGGQLGFRLAGPLDPTMPEQEFQALGLAFAFGPEGSIEVAGALEGAYPPGAVLIHGRSFAPLAYAPERPATVAELIRTLAPEGSSRPDLLIPARRDALLIHRYLPAPPVDLQLHRTGSPPGALHQPVDMKEAMGESVR